MRRLVSKLTFAVLLGSAVSIACGDDDDSSAATGGKGGAGGQHTGGSGGSSAGGSSGQHSGGSNSGGSAHGGSSAGASTQGGSSAGGSAHGGSQTGGEAGASGGGAGPSGGVGGDNGGAGAGGEAAGGTGGEGGAAFRELIARGEYLVTAVAQCGGCHTDSSNPSALLGGNPAFKAGGTSLPAPNLTPDATGLGNWTDEEIKNAFMNGIDDEGRQLNGAMPYWLFHNLTTDDANAIVAFLRSLPKVSNSVGESNPAGTAVAPLSPSAFPDTSFTSGADRTAALEGKYLLTSAARCVSCHSTSTAGVLAPGFAGRAPATAGNVYPPNLTPDTTGTAGWTAADIATVLLTSNAKGTSTPLCSMPKYSKLTAEDATAIGTYLTSIPPVVNNDAKLSALPACP